MSMKHELQRIISGNGSVRNGKIIQTITDHLRREKKTVSAIKKAKFDKEQETQILVGFIEVTGLWYKQIDESRYIGEGAEQKIFEYSDTKFVLKLNDSIFMHSGKTI
jgi:hypothetical protein